jgi:hypothetical protein
MSMSSPQSMVARNKQVLLSRTAELCVHTVIIIEPSDHPRARVEVVLNVYNSTTGVIPAMRCLNPVFGPVPRTVFAGGFLRLSRFRPSSANMVSSKRTRAHLLIDR